MDEDTEAIIKKHKKRTKEGRCLFVDQNGLRCSGKAISSHTVQKGDALKSIAEKGHVYQLTVANPYSQTRPRIDFVNTGLRKASVFPGFCKRHDNDLFSEVERNAVLGSKRQAALIGYRVICLELFKKEANAQLFSDEALRKIALQNGRATELESYLAGTKLGLADLQRAKLTYENAIHQNCFKDFHAAVFFLEDPLPFCFASTFSPEYDFQGNRLLPGPEDEWEAAASFAGTVAGQSLFLFCGYQRSDRQEVVRYLKSLSEIPLGFVGSAALYTAIEYSENSFFRKSWVDSLDEVTREKIRAQFESGTPGNANLKKAKILELEDFLQIGSPEKPTIFL